MVRRQWLVADIGGTNARFALVDEGTAAVTEQITMPTTSAATLPELIGDYLRRVDGGTVVAACLACAGPVRGDRCSLTNAGIDFLIEDTRMELGLEKLLVVNDFAATARAVPELGSADVLRVGDLRPCVDQGAVAIGPGTGLGVATVLREDRGWRVLVGEGDHVALSALFDDELEVVRALRRRFGFVSAEMVLSGPGRTRLFLTLSEIRGDALIDESRAIPNRIVESACSGADETSVATLTMFCRLLATTAANAALTTGAGGGVFLAGGIIRRFPDFVVQSSFRERFTSHAHAGRHLEQIPTAIVTAPEPGLVGAMHLLADAQRREPLVDGRRGLAHGRGMLHRHDAATQSSSWPPRWLRIRTDRQSASSFSSLASRRSPRVSPVVLPNAIGEEGWR